MWVSKVEFACPICQCDNKQEVSVPEPDYTGENHSDMMSVGEIELCCNDCDTCFNCSVSANLSDCYITILDYEDTEVVCEPPAPEKWNIPEDPKAVFDLNSTELRDLINDQASDDGGNLINRMIFAQILTFLETYFCDNLIKGLRNHPDLLVEFSEKDGTIKQANISASDVLRDPNVVKNLIENNLKGRLYHQFGSGKKDPKTGKEKREGVPLWYMMAFRFLLTPNEDDLKKLRKYALLRHDCVHRNGKTRDDDKLTLFDKNYLLETLDTADRVVAHIDSKMLNLSTPDAKS